MSESEDRLGKYALMGFLERYVEEMEDEYERQKAQVSGKGQDAYQSDL